MLHARDFAGAGRGRGRLMFSKLLSVSDQEGPDGRLRGSCPVFGGRAVWFAVAWLASATAVAQEGTPPGGVGADAAKPAVEGQPPDAAAEAAARQESAARQEQEAREREARERAELRSDLNALRAEVASERAARLAAESALGARADLVARQVSEAPPGLSSARLGLGLTGFVQNDLTFRQSSQNQLSPSGVPLNEDRFLIRRARIRATVDRWWVAGAVEFDGNTVNGPAARVIGAEASLKWPPQKGDPLPLLMATVGAFKIPFGFEVGQSDRERLFIDRSTAEHGLFPGEYDLGARLLGGWRFVRYAFAVMNGEPVGERTGFPFRDPNQQKDVVGRVGVDATVAPSVWIAGGFSGLSGTGFHPGTPATKSTVQWSDRNANGAIDPARSSSSPARRPPPP